MICAQARRLFGACWDDEITQAEREALESHFTSCADCRAEYDGYSRSLELLTSLPRIEPAPDLVERALARSRRVAPAPDRVEAPGIQWVPVTAAAALAVIAVTLVTPWIAPRYGPTSLLDGGDTGAIVQPVLRAPVAGAPEGGGMATRAGRGATTGGAGAAMGPVATVPDSLFDHSEDVEFILDAMTLRRGRPAAVRTHGTVQGQQATITF